MVLLVIGIVLWIAPHLVKRLVPGVRAGLDARIGPGPARGVVAAVIAIGLVLMILGFRAAPMSPSGRRRGGRRMSTTR